MSIHASNTSTALGWVREDLDRLISNARQQIEHLASNPHAGKDALRETAAGLEHLRWTFEALSLNGAAMLSIELAEQCGHIEHYRVDSRDTALAAMMESVVVLPSYLDRLQAGHPDLPMLLLPAVNTLRATHHGALLQENAIFSPELDVAMPELDLDAQEATREESFETFADRMRQQYENALMNWLQEQKELAHLSPLQGVCETLMHRVPTPEQQRLWWVASEVIGGLTEGHVNNDAAMRRLFSRLHLNLKALASGDQAAGQADAVKSLTRAFLFQAAQAKPGCAGLDDLRERFGLAGQIPDQEELLRAQGAVAGRNREMYLSLGSAVQDELSLVKDALDLELRTGDVDEKRRDLSLDALNRLHDTLRMLGLLSPADALRDMLPEFKDSAKVSAEEREPALMMLASQLLMIESALQQQIETMGDPLEEQETDSYLELPSHEMTRIRGHLMDELVANVYIFQEAVKARFGGNGDAELDEPLQQLAGGLRLLGENEASDCTLRLATVSEFLLGNAFSESAVDPDYLAALTDSVAALELFLAACRDQTSGRERFLQTLQHRLNILPDSKAAAAHLAAKRAEAAALEPAASEAFETVALQTGSGDDLHALPAEMDAELLEVFIEEYESVAEAFNHQIPDWLKSLEDTELLIEIRRGFHTLKGSGRMVGAHEMGDFCWQIEELLNALLDKNIDCYADVAVMVRLAQAALPALKQRLMQQPVGLSPDAIKAIGRHAEHLTASADANWPSLHRALPAFLAGMLPSGPDQDGHDRTLIDDDRMVGILRQELSENLLPLHQLLEQVSGDHSTRASRDHLRAVHTIAGSLAMMPDGREAEIAKALEGLLEAQSINGAAFSVESIWALGSAIGHLQARLDRLDGQSDAAGDMEEQELIDLLITQTVHMEAAEPAADPEPEDLSETEEESQQSADEAALAATMLAGQEPAPEPEAAGSDDAFDEAFDDEITAIFLEEAHEVLGRADGLLNEWHDDLENMSLIQNLQREIHTFKGGARMAGLAPLGALSHTMETLLERLAERTLSPSVSAIQVLESGCDRLQEWVRMVAAGRMPDGTETLTLFEQQVDDLSSLPTPAAIGNDEPAERREIQSLPETDSFDAEVPETEQPDPEQPDSDLPAAPADQASIRVAADLLDSLVNAAGEVSILRSRLEQKMGSLRSNLNEFDETIARLKEQFRKLEMETEAQIKSRHQDVVETQTEDFDPLELDRFSSMQQLSRGLSESVSDLLNLQEMLGETARHSETLLTQQSRFTTELQEGLMRTRMVPFGSIAPRLRRLVRSAARETGKQARLQMEMVGTSDQLDRNVLERITAPLEHMLRNSIVHGIEKPAARKSAGKEPEGSLTVTVESEATEFIIRIRDDGGGINLQAIRKKAIELGMLNEDSAPPDQQLYEFILDSGFSTTTTVTGLAGRGVGMDVVNSEIKQIGGSLEIDSETGTGTCFTIRIPFTLAVMQAIGARAGQNRYLIPLASVAGVARSLPQDYRVLIEQDEPMYEFGGESWPVLELEPLLGEPSQPLSNDNVSLLMIRAGDQRAALRVTELLGHREIVIKPVGPQISSVPGILGGTVNADGHVQIILDTGPLIRHAMMHGARPMPVSEDSLQPRQTLAMVVDDSITMRKVTTRVLESHNFEVITAKDGIDATEQLQDRVPDLLLLDIEMPRMDGYGVAEHVRADPRLRHIPIVMITSRSGQKHRDRAEKAGADAYLTKPYKESELVLQVNALLGKET